GGRLCLCRALPRCLPPARVDRALRPRRSNEGAGDPRTPPRGLDPSPTGQPAAASAARSAAARRVQPHAAAPLLERILRSAGDGAVLASAAGRSALDLSAPSPGPAADQP